MTKSRMKRRVEETKPTFQRIPGKAQLAYDVSRNIGLDALAHLGLTLCSLQTLVKLLRVKLLQQQNREICFREFSTVLHQRLLL